ncbi:hypothetical protein [Brachybacterium sacelli]|uniref:Toxin-antitoxin system HicB family antitoxin n=1 Tax=Brachybacterium sacelli TaxID=173364 RepID=A0ABS4X037_9MICO|nr:hypothetical protein [Brachybacterium sacelli]MBP2381099.1 hypothetical protein [Brachybacterium sacelli]
MELRPLTRSVQEQLAASAAIGDEATQRAAQLLSVSLEPALRIALQDAVSQVAAEVSAGIAPGRVELALRGGEVDVQVVPPAAPTSTAPSAPPAPPVPPQSEGEDPAADASAARVTFRPPQQLKARLEQAAVEQSLSLNAYLVRALRSHLEGAAGAQDHRSTPFRSSGRTSGWFL